MLGRHRRDHRPACEGGKMEDMKIELTLKQWIGVSQVEKMFDKSINRTEQRP